MTLDADPGSLQGASLPGILGFGPVVLGTAGPALSCWRTRRGA
jgi:hypothetical protein